MVTQDKPEQTEQLSESGIFKEKIKVLKETFKVDFLSVWRHMLCKFDGDRFALLDSFLISIGVLISQVGDSTCEDKDKLFQELCTFETQATYTVNLLRVLKKDLDNVRDKFQTILDTI